MKIKKPYPHYFKTMTKYFFNNEEISLENLNSYHFWYKFEYNENGDEIYYENSSGIKFNY